MLIKHNDLGGIFFQKKNYQKKKFQKILALIDEQEKEETRQLYEELHGYVEVSDINLLKGMWVVWTC